MPRTALRYAIEHFEPVERQHYLAIPRQREPKQRGRANTPSVRVQFSTRFSNVAGSLVTSPWKDPAR
jgi:hypothetical protein